MKIQTAINFAALDANALKWKDLNHPFAYLSTVLKYQVRLLEIAIQKHQFDHPEWVAKVCNTFMDRYIETLEQVRFAAAARRAWRLTFLAAASPSMTLVQHLMLGLNAYSKLIVPEGLATTLNRAELNEFEGDYLKINDILKPHYDLLWRWLVAVYKLEELENSFFSGPMWFADPTILPLDLPRPLAMLEWIWLESQKFLGAEARANAFASALQIHEGSAGTLNRLDLEAENAAKQFYAPNPVLKMIFEKLKLREASTVPANCAELDALAAVDKAYFLC